MKTIRNSPIFKILKAFFIFFLSVALIAGISFFGFQRYLFLKIPSLVTDISKRHYALDYSKLKIRINPLSLELDEVALSPVDSVVERLKKANPEKTFYTFRAGKLYFRNIDALKLFKQKKLEIGSVEIIRPEFKVTGVEITNKFDSLKIYDRLFVELNPLFGKLVNEISIQNIRFRNAQFGFYRNSGIHNHVSGASEIAMEITGFRTTPDMISRRKDFFDSDEINVYMLGFHNDVGDSLHVVSIDTVQYSLKKSYIKAAGFKVAYTHCVTDRNRYKINVPKLFIRSSNLSRFSIHDSLQVNFIEFNNPEIKFVQKLNPRHVTIHDINQFDLYTVVKSQFSIVDVDTFYLKNARLDIYQQPDTLSVQQQIDNLNIKLYGFNLDSVSFRNKNKLFYADNIEMAAKGYFLALNDNTHFFKSDSIYVSGFTNSIRVANIVFKPVEQAKIKGRTLVAVNCKNLNFEGIDLKKLYHTRKLTARLIGAKLPEVTVKNYGEKARKQKTSNPGFLYRMVSPYLKGTYAEKVNIENGRLDIETITNKKPAGYFTTRFNFLLHGFSLDSASILRNDLFFYASDFDLGFSHYEMKLVDNIHKLSVSKVKVESRNSKMVIDSLHLQPEQKNISERMMKQVNKAELYNISVPHIELSGVDLNQAFFYNNLNINYLTILNPSFFFENYSNLKNEKDKKNLHELYNLLFTYIENTDIKNLQFDNGNVQWINHSRKGNTTMFNNKFTAGFYKFRLNKDELEKEGRFFSENYELKVKDQEFRMSDSLHVLRAEEIDYSSALSLIKIKNGRILPMKNVPVSKTSSNLFDINIPELEIQGFDFETAWRLKKLSLKQIELKSPDINIQNKGNQLQKGLFENIKLPLPAFVQSLELQKFMITNGNVNAHISSKKEENTFKFILDLTIPGIFVKNNDRKVLQFNSNNLTGEVRNLQAQISGNLQVGLEKCTFNRELKTFSVTGLNIRTLPSNNKLPEFSILSPQVNLEGINYQGALEKDELEIDQLVARGTKIGFDISESKKDPNRQVNLYNLYPIVNQYFNSFKAKKLLFPETYLKITKGHKLWFDKVADIALSGVAIKDDKNDKLLHSDESDIKIYNPEKTNNEGLYRFRGDLLHFNSKNRSIVFLKPEVKPVCTFDEFNTRIGIQRDYILFSSNSAELKGVDVRKFISGNGVFADKMIVGPSELEFRRNKKLPVGQEGKAKWPQDLLFSSKTDFRVDSTIVMPSLVKYSELAPASNTFSTLEFSDLTLKSGALSGSRAFYSGNKKLNVDISARFMAKYPVKAKLVFYPEKPDYQHSLTGRMDSMQLSSLNSFLRNSSQVQIESGSMKALNFDLTFNQNSGKGNVVFEYNNFKLSVYEQPGDSRKEKLASLWVNTMIIRPDNPRGQQPIKPVYVENKNDLNRSVINLWWKTIFAGIKETIGIKKQEPK